MFHNLLEYFAEKKGNYNLKFLRIFSRWTIRHSKLAGQNGARINEIIFVKEVSVFQHYITHQLLDPVSLKVRSTI